MASNNKATKNKSQLESYKSAYGTVHGKTNSNTSNTSNTSSNKSTQNNNTSNTSKTTNYTPTGSYNDAGVSQWAQTQINNYKQQYNDAMARGDEEGMRLAHADAEAIRKKYGYSGGDDGSEYNLLPQENKVFDYEYEYNDPQPTAPQQDPRIAEMLNEILNRGDFSYDVESDPLYQQYSQMYQREGDRAMRDTMAEAAASAGGMNSYAMTAAQQANNYYGSQLNDKIPELYQLAYDMYLADKESKVQDLGLLQQLDQTQYNRYIDTMNNWKDDRNFAYGVYRDNVGDQQWQDNFNYTQFVNDRDFAYTSDWANKQWDYNVGQDTLKNDQYERESAKEEVWKYIELGITPSADLFARAGMSESDVALAVAAVQAEQTKKGTTGNSYKYVDSGGTPTGDGTEGYTSVNGLGIGPISDDLLLNLIEQGVVIMNAAGNVKWADGYNKNNYREALLK